MARHVKAEFAGEKIKFYFGMNELTEFKELAQIAITDENAWKKAFTDVGHVRDLLYVSAKRHFARKGAWTPYEAGDLLDKHSDQEGCYGIGDFLQIISPLIAYHFGKSMSAPVEDAEGSADDQGGGKGNDSSAPTARSPSGS